MVSLVLPSWGIAMIAVGANASSGWWIASGVVVLLVGAVFFAGSSLVTAFLPGGRRFG